VEKVVMIYSGGLDSTVLLYHLRSQDYDLIALSVDYGQRHRKELDSAHSICHTMGIPHEVADLRGITHLLKGSSLTDSEIDVPDGHYAEESMKVTVVPNRNMIMLSVAIGYAISIGAKFVAYGAHAGDHTIYPDCRPEFAAAIDTAALLADWHQVELLRPFIRLTKAEIAKLGAELNVPFELTWSCYKGGEHHCGSCGTCVERAEAFNLAGLQDPTEYEDARSHQAV
jgi:7-cyano-7-deazaguanine synthase